MSILKRYGTGNFRVERLWNDDGRAYLTRIFLPWGYRVNIFHSEDPDPDPHDHPWNFWTFPLAAYVEDVWMTLPQAPTHTIEGKLLGKRECFRRVVRPFYWNFRHHGHIHRVLRRKKRGLFLGCNFVTIMKVAGPIHSWGFWPRYQGVRGVSFVPWRRYCNGDRGCLSSGAIVAPELVGE